MLVLKVSKQDFASQNEITRSSSLTPTHFGGNWLEQRAVTVNFNKEDKKASIMADLIPHVERLFPNSPKHPKTGQHKLGAIEDLCNSKSKIFNSSGLASIEEALAAYVKNGVNVTYITRLHSQSGVTRVTDFIQLMFYPDSHDDPSESRSLQNALTYYQWVGESIDPEKTKVVRNKWKLNRNQERTNWEKIQIQLSSRPRREFVIVEYGCKSQGTTGFERIMKDLLEKLEPHAHVVLRVVDDVESLWNNVWKKKYNFVKFEGLKGQPDLAYYRPPSRVDARQQGHSTGNPLLVTRPVLVQTNMASDDEHSVISGPPTPTAQAPPAQAPPARKASARNGKNGKASQNKNGKKATARKNFTSYSSYIYKVLKQVHPEIGISGKGMQVMNDIVKDFSQRLIGEANVLVSMNKQNTVSARDIQSAVRLLFPGELAKHAVSEGTKAVTKWSAYKKSKPQKNKTGK
jgi:histone H2B